MPLAALSLAGCVTVRSEYVCPRLEEYSKTQQTRLANELDAAPQDAIWPKFIIDYSRHRTACRAIEDDDE